MKLFMKEGNISLIGRLTRIEGNTSLGVYSRTYFEFDAIDANIDKSGFHDEIMREKMPR